jgi:hypothetical protein
MPRPQAVSKTAAGLDCQFEPGHIPWIPQDWQWSRVRETRGLSSHPLISFSIVINVVLPQKPQPLVVKE